jgi:hypothetical protein
MRYCYHFFSSIVNEGINNQVIYSTHQLTPTTLVAGLQQGLAWVLI